MNKKIKNLFLAGALVLGLAGVAVSCTDYDQDINDLQSKLTEATGKISNLEANVAALQGAINAGAVITSVTPITGENGGWKFTLSDGNSYNVTNGAPGAPGAAGAAGKDGKWYVPNAETGCWDIHEMVNGEEVVTATEQKYIPENGTSIAYDAEKNALVITVGEETKEISLTPTSESGLVFVPQCYVDGVEGLMVASLYYNPLEIVLDAKKNSTIDTKNEKWQIIQEPVINEKTGQPIEGQFKNKEVQVPIASTAFYHVNVSDFEFDDTFDYKFIYTDVPFIKTRTMFSSTKDFSIEAEFAGYADGILAVNIYVTGYEAWGPEITRFALQATKDGKTVTSDYATLFSFDMVDVRIADFQEVAYECKGEAEEHYRRGTEGISGKDSEAFLSDQEVWTEQDMTLEAAHATCDTAVAYDGSIDLKTITIPHFLTERNVGWYNVLSKGRLAADDEDLCDEMTLADMEAAGLTFVYEVVKNYKIGKPVTDQAEFVTLADGVFTPRTFTTEGTAAIGRTPIIRVKLMHGDDIVQVAYIKVYIAERVDPNAQFELIPVRQDGDKNYPQGENVFRFKCEGDSLMTTVKDMNEIIYNGLNTSKDKFHGAYKAIKAMPAMFAPKSKSKTPDLVLGEVHDVVVDPVTGTHVISWVVKADELWDYAGQEVAVIARYYYPDNEAIYVDVKLTATVADALKDVALSSAEGDYILNMWTPGYTATKYNVRVPNVADTAAKDSALCQFNNDINASFVTYPAKDKRAGQIKLNDAIDSVVYWFCAPHIEGDKEKGIPAISKIGKLNVKFRVGDNGDTLFATILDDKGKVAVEEDSVAIIINKPVNTNEADNTVWNTFHYVKGQTVADTLLNTGEMYTFIGATAYLCTKSKETETKEVEVSFDGADHFRANILRPVNVSTKSKKGYVDAVDFGEDGSYIKIEDLIDPIDWRQRLFSEYPSYWNYYGKFVVTVDIENAECDLNNVRQSIPTTIVLTQVTELDAKVPVLDKNGKPTGEFEVKKITNEAGFLTYKNNLTNVTEDFNIFVKAKVRYGFGYIDSEWITIPVAKTIGQTTE